MTSPHLSVKAMLLLCAIGCVAWVRPAAPDRVVVPDQSRAEDRPADPQTHRDHPAERPSDQAARSDRPGVRLPGRGDRARDGRDGAAGDALPLWDRLNDQQRRRLRAFVQEHFPEVFAELEWLEANRPRQALNRMRRFAPDMFRLRKLLQNQPRQARLAIEERRLDLQIHVRVRDYWASDSEIDRAELRDEITERLHSLFDVRLQRRKMEVERLRNRLEGLRRRLEHAEQNRETMIERQLAEKLDPRPMRDRPPGTDRRRNDSRKDDGP